MGSVRARGGRAAGNRGAKDRRAQLQGIALQLLPDRLEFDARHMVCTVHIGGAEPFGGGNFPFPNAAYNPTPGFHPQASVATWPHAPFLIPVASAGRPH